MATLSFYYRAPHRFTPIEMETARTLANVAAVAVTTAELYDEQRRTREQAAFLAQASAALSDSLEFETTLNTVARLAVPGIADSCAIHLLDEDDSIRLVAAVHVDPEKAAADADDRRSEDLVAVAHVGSHDQGGNVGAARRHLGGRHPSLARTAMNG